MDNQSNVCYTTKLHSELLVIMDEIDRICKLHNIHYYLIGGTLLGAIRHNGFIPWDDDLDIVMPRNDLKIFKEFCAKELNPMFVFEDGDNESNYPYFFSKVINKDTKFYESEIEQWRHSGIFVDIFPLDTCNGYSKSVELKKWLIKTINNSIWAFLKKDTRLRRFPHRIFAMVFRPKFMHCMMKSIAKCGGRQGNYYANYGSQYKIKKQTMPKKWFGNGTPLLFEGHKYIAPVDYQKVVESIFGKNYMQLPPENKRRCHYPSYVLFSDNTEMSFSRPLNQVSFKEQELEDEKQ